MDVYYPVGIFPGEITGEYAEETREDNELYAPLFQRGVYLLLKGLLTSGGAAGDGERLNAVVSRTFEGVSALDVRDDEAYFATFNDPAFLRVYQCLKIGATAGHQHGYAGFAQHMMTPSSEAVTSPIT